MSRHLPAIAPRRDQDGPRRPLRRVIGTRRGLIRAATAIVGMIAVLGVAAPVSASPPPEPVDEFYEQDPFAVPEIEVETSGGELAVGSDPGSVIDGRGPLYEVPPGCPSPELAALVFEGEVIETDDRAARFSVAQVRAGDLEDLTGAAVEDGVAADVVEVRYGLEVQYIETGETYLVAAQLEPLLGLLYSRVSDPAPLFGGDEVVGLAEIDLDCPEFVDPIRTLRPDGSVVATSVTQPLFDNRNQVIAAAILPFAVVFAVVFVLAAFATSLKGMLRGLAARSRRR